MTVLKKIADAVGALICHQLPGRSLVADGLQLPVCARDTGIYLGIFVGASFVLLSGRGRSDRLPRLPAAIVLCALMTPMVFDGICSYLGIYETNNTARLLTGALFGLPIPLFLAPAANFRADGKNEAAVLKGWAEPAGLVAVVLALSLLILRGYVPYVVLAAVFILSFLFLVGRLSYTVVSRSFRIKGLYKYLLSAGATLCILTVLHLFSAFVLQPLKAVFAG